MAPVPFEQFAEQLLRTAPIEKMRLVGSPLVGVAGRYCYAIDPDFHDIVEKASDSLGVGCIEQSGVDIDPKPARFCEFDRCDGAVVDPALAHCSVVILAVTVE